jgi:hypothetical protein
LYITGSNSKFCQTGARQPRLARPNAVLLVKEFSMLRRDFLKLSGLASMFLALNLGNMENLVHFDAQTATGKKAFRGGLEGKIFVSEDQGKTWAVHTDLGPQYTVLGLFNPSGGQIYAEVWFQEHKFHLALTPDGKRWQTVLRPAARVINS